MTFSQPGARLALAFAALAFATVSLPADASQKFDAGLSNALQQSGLLAAGKPGAGPVIRKAVSSRTVKVLVRFHSGAALDAIRGAGGIVHSVLGDIASAEIPVAALADLAALDEIVYMEAEKAIPARLNVSVPATRANLLRSGVSPDLAGATGAGVIVGIVDDGLDFRSLDFRNTDGSTRLLGLWDQRVAGAAGTPPAGFDYGGECTIKMLNDAIGGNPGCTQPSTGNHGTHVAGIAAGNGQQSGNGLAPYRFVGMAPKADILAANSIAGGTGSNAVVDAIAWMKARAAALGKPLVVNLSLGSYFGARDGTSNFEQALSNAGAAGVIIAAAAGNEGSDKIVASGTISAGETKSVTFNWPNTVRSSQRIEMWYPGTNKYAIKLTGPNGCAMPEFVPAETTNTFTGACGSLIVSSTAPQANNDDRQILVAFIVDPANPSGFAGNWTYEVRGDVVAAPNTSFSMICAEDGNGLVFTSNTPAGFTQGILTDTASATRTIAVGSYNTNSSWLTTGGTPNVPANYDFGPLTDLSRFSSRGPRRNCSNPAKCPPAMKPEITAPGAMIVSTLGQDAAVPANDSLEADGKHVAYNGTSMATPHLAGALALMLQKNPTLTPEQAKQILFQHVQTNSFTTALPAFNPASPLMPAAPNVDWGYGILDAQAAYNAVPAPAAAPQNYTDSWWNANESGWGITITDHMSNMFVQWYTYDQTGHNQKYVISGGTISSDRCHFSGTIQQVSGPSWTAASFDPAQVVRRIAGSGTIDFCATGLPSGTIVFNYTADGVTASKQLTRLPFGNDVPRWGGTANTGAPDFSDLWWNPAESGWGVSLTQHGNGAFFRVFAYDTDSRPLLFIVSATLSAGGMSFTGPVIMTSGPWFGTNPFDPSQVTRRTAGAATLSFSDQNNGTLTYTVDGVTKTKAITRLVF